MAKYISLTKPTIVLLFGLTGFTAMVLERSLLAEPFRAAIILLGIILTAGSANSLNMYFDRDIDQIMDRTRKKRALPLQKIEPLHALWFGLVLGAIATGILLYFANPLTTLLGVGTILFYVGFYTLFLKRRTPYNIVIGGAAGATAPLMGWAAGSGDISMVAFLLFLIIFMWTPPHFWALALVVKDEYKAAGVPMLPVVAGVARTRLEILIYTILLIPLTLLPQLIAFGGKIYLYSGIILGALFLRQTIILMKQKNDKSAYRVFGFSIVYLLTLFICLMIGNLIHI